METNTNKTIQQQNQPNKKKENNRIFRPKRIKLENEKLNIILNTAQYHKESFELNEEFFLLNTQNV